MQTKSLTISFGDVVRRLRHRSNLSQEKLAELCCMHRTYIGFIERGEKTVSIETAKKISEALGVNLSSLFQEIENSNVN